MKANELRIGNLVQHYGYPDDIWPVDFALLENISLGLNQVEGIPLTEEWLMKFGFLKIGKFGFFHLDSLYLTYNDDKTIFYFQYRTKASIIHAVHQLQNLYFALTGQELTIES
jgi:hypothetical protein